MKNQRIIQVDDLEANSSIIECVNVEGKESKEVGGGAKKYELAPLESRTRNPTV